MDKDNRENAHRNVDGGGRRKRNRNRRNGDDKPYHRPEQTGWKGYGYPNQPNQCMPWGMPMQVAPGMYPGGMYIPQGPGLDFMINPLQAAAMQAALAQQMLSGNAMNLNAFVHGPQAQAALLNQIPSVSTAALGYDMSKQQQFAAATVGNVVNPNLLGHGSQAASLNQIPSVSTAALGYDMSKQQQFAAASVGNVVNPNSLGHGSQAASLYQIPSVSTAALGYDMSKQQQLAAAATVGNVVNPYSLCHGLQAASLNQIRSVSPAALSHDMSKQQLGAATVSVPHVSAVAMSQTTPVTGSVSKPSATVTSLTSTSAVAIPPRQSGEAFPAKETSRQTRSSTQKSAAPTTDLSYVPPKSKHVKEDDFGDASDLDNYESDQGSNSDCILVEGDPNLRGVYLPGKSKPVNIDEEIGGESSEQGAKPTKQKKGTSVKTGTKSGGKKKGTIHESTIANLREKAVKMFDAPASKPLTKVRKTVAIKQQAVKPFLKNQTRSSQKQDLVTDDFEFDTLHEVEEKVNKTIRGAYARSRTSDEDLADIAALKAAGVLLPNGLVPFSPCINEDGEKMLTDLD